MLSAIPAWGNPIKIRKMAQLPHQKVKPENLMTTEVFTTGGTGFGPRDVTPEAGKSSTLQAGRVVDTPVQGGLGYQLYTPENSYGTPSHEGLVQMIFLLDWVILRFHVNF